MGDSGRAVAKLLKQKEAQISFYDEDVRFFDQIGFERNPQNTHWDLVILSPGVKCRNNPILKSFEEQKISVISEIDFAYLNSQGKVLAVTGTNGKTTVCMLVNRILKMAGYKTFLCGNIGLPFSAICQQTSKDSVVVCEVSNFQLEASRFFRADVASILNVRPDHLDRHGSFAEYVRVKGKIAKNLKRKDLLILNLDDQQSKKLILHKKFMFFSKNRLKKGVCVWKNQICINRKGVLNLSDIHLKGEKNLENVLASVAITSQFKISKQTYCEAVKSFVPASHRMECVGTLNGVTYIDDSKATNVASTVACVEAFKEHSIWLLVGGQSKEISYSDLFSQNFAIKRVVTFGQDGQKIEECARSFGYATCQFQKMTDAVKFCKSEAVRGDYVLLSPACASYDEFSSYAERGDHFKKLVLDNSEATDEEI